jgi:hypothetical protein
MSSADPPSTPVGRNAAEVPEETSDDESPSGRNGRETICVHLQGYVDIEAGDTARDELTRGRKKQDPAGANPVLQGGQRRDSSPDKDIEEFIDSYYLDEGSQVACHESETAQSSRDSENTIKVYFGRECGNLDHATDSVSAGPECEIGLPQTPAEEAGSSLNSTTTALEPQSSPSHSNLSLHSCMPDASTDHLVSSPPTASSRTSPTVQENTKNTADLPTRADGRFMKGKTPRSCTGSELSCQVS